MPKKGFTTLGYLPPAVIRAPIRPRSPTDIDTQEQQRKKKHRKINPDEAAPVPDLDTRS